MAEDQDKSSQTEAPTARRLSQARSKGDVAKSQDVPAFLGVAAASGVLLFGGGAMARGMVDALTPFFAHPDAFDLSGQGTVSVMYAAVRASAPGMVVMLVAGVAGAVGHLIQTGFLWAPDKLAPDLSKFNLIQGFGRMFGIDALANFLKSLLKIIAIGAVAWWVLKPKADMLTQLTAMEPMALLPLSVDLLRALAVAILVVLGVVAGADWFWTRYRFSERMKMSREDVKQDTKEADGDPHVKARQRQIRLQRAKRRMMQNVPKATVVVMNPTHFAVALRYVQGETAAPVCVAKGQDNVALRIRALAEQHGVPVVEDAPLARALYASIDLDQTIPREHYQAVAKIIGFVMGGTQGRASAAQGRPARL
jgi:flagellar biosynthetic protein FlhB